MRKRYRDRVIEGKDKKGIFLRTWDNVEFPKGVVQIIHGMAEHSLRYNEFAEYLNSKGYVVYADDHRGHGETGENDGAYGYLGEDGFNLIVEDQLIITKLAKKEQNNIPVYIFAHSFGSFIGQDYITKYSEHIEGIILSGSSKQDGFDVKLGLFVSNIQKKICGEEKQAKLIDKLSFGAFNKQVKNPKTKFDWLTRDEKEVDKYINDRHCGFCSTINFYNHLFNAFKNLYSGEKLSRIRKNLKITVVSGDKDPVGKYGKGVKNLHKQYIDLGIKAEIKLFKDGRHEMLNEINKEEVYEYILSVLN